MLCFFLNDLHILSIVCICNLTKKNPDNKQSEDWKMSVVHFSVEEGFIKHHKRASLRHRGGGV